MNTTAIMTDSNSGITPSEAHKLGIFSIPMPIIIDGDVFYEGIDITQEEFFDKLTSGCRVSTSQPSPGDVIDMWNNILAAGYKEIVYVPMSSGLSASCKSATALSMEFNGKVHIADNHRISVTQRQSVFDALELANSGATGAEIKSALEGDAYNSSIYIAVDTLEYLKRGGRVTPAGAALGTVLNIKPILTIQGERLDAFSKVRGMKRCQKKIIDAVGKDISERFKDVKKSDLIIGAAGTFINPLDAEDWKNQLQTEFPEIEVYYNPLSFSIGCHVGPNATGIGISVKFKV